jgi:hypothetical protein
LHVTSERLVLTTFYPQKALHIFQNAHLSGVCGWEDNIKMYLREIYCDGMDWIHLVDDRGSVAVSCEHSNEPSAFIKYCEITE